MHVRATYREYNETTEVEFKGCVPVDSLRSKYNEICNQSKGVTECSHVCCRENLCNENINQGEGCLKCDYCPGSEESLVFNHSTPLNTSYTSHQCNDESEQWFAHLGISASDCTENSKTLKWNGVFAPLRSTATISMNFVGDPIPGMIHIAMFDVVSMTCAIRLRVFT